MRVPAERFLLESKRLGDLQRCFWAYGTYGSGVVGGCEAQGFMGPPMREEGRREEFLDLSRQRCGFRMAECPRLLAASCQQQTLAGEMKVSRQW